MHLYDYLTKLLTHNELILCVYSIIDLINYFSLLTISCFKYYFHIPNIPSIGLNIGEKGGPKTILIFDRIPDNSLEW